MYFGGQNVNLRLLKTFRGISPLTNSIVVKWGHQDNFKPVWLFLRKYFASTLKRVTSKNEPTKQI